VRYQVGNKVQPGDIMLMHFRPTVVQDFIAGLQAIKDAGLTPALLEDYIGGTPPPVNPPPLAPQPVDPPYEVLPCPVMWLMTVSTMTCTPAERQVFTIAVKSSSVPIRLFSV